MEAQAQLSPGTEVYLEDGQLAEFCAKVSGGYVVQPIYGGDDEEPYIGDAITVRAVFDKPPVPRYDAETKRVLAELEKARAALDEVRGSIHAHNAEAAQIKASLRKHNMLAEIEAALEDRLTHVVTMAWEGDIKCVALAEALQDRDSKWRLVPLMLEAQLNGEKASLRWCAGQSSSTEFKVFTSEEAARAYAVDLAEKMAGAVRQQLAKQGHDHRVPGVVRSFARLGLEAPPDLAEHVRAVEERLWREALTKVEGEAAIYRERLNAVLPKAEA
jgi:hypothetical protein